MSQTQNEIKLQTTESSVKFLHFRDISPTGEVNPRGGVTIAYHGFQPSEDTQLVTFAAARCSKDDNFERAEGRAIAATRLYDGTTAGWAGVHNERELAKLMEDYLRGTFGYTRKFSRKRRR